MIDEQVWRSYVMDYDIDVPQERVEQELQLIRADLMHRMRYEQMMGGPAHLFPDVELAQQEDALLEAAVFEAKEPLVLRALAQELEMSVTPEELLAEAEAMAQRQSCALDEIKRFFGEDFALLERDVRDNKIRAWACEQR